MSILYRLSNYLLEDVPGNKRILTEKEVEEYLDTLNKAELLELACSGGVYVL